MVLVLIALYGIVQGPWWLVALAIVLSSLRFRAWEAILVGCMADLYWLPTGGLLHSVPVMTLGALLVVWAFEPIRRKLLFFIP